MDLGTDPTKADTDEDGMKDKVEVDRGTDPLTKDKYSRFRFLDVTCDQEEDHGDVMELNYRLYIRKGPLVYPVVWENEIPLDTGQSWSIDWTRTFTITEGEIITIQSRDSFEHDTGLDDHDYFPNAAVDYTYTSDYPAINMMLHQRNEPGDRIHLRYNVEEILGVPDD